MSAVSDSAAAHAATVTEPLRRCALMLHAVAAVDRDWVLSQLDARRRTELEPLLAELHTLGIAPDPGFAKLACVDRIALMARALRSEPPRLVALFLMSAGDDVARQILLGMDVVRRQSVQQQLDVLQAVSLMAAPPRLAAALQHGLEQRMRDSEATAATAFPPATSSTILHSTRLGSMWRRIVRSFS